MHAQERTDGMAAWCAPGEYLAMVDKGAHVGYCILEATSAPYALDATTTLLAEDFFGKVFLAGMSIAAAAVGATVFVGFIVRNRYDDIESSYFQAQDDELSRQNAADQKQTASGDQTARDFFGDVNAREETPSDDR